MIINNVLQIFSNALWSFTMFYRSSSVFCSHSQCSADLLQCFTIIHNVLQIFSDCCEHFWCIVNLLSCCEHFWCITNLFNCVEQLYQYNCDEIFVKFFHLLLNKFTHTTQQSFSLRLSVYSWMSIFNHAVKFH